MNIGSTSPPSDRMVLRRIRELLRSREIEVRYKNESRFMKFLAALLFFAPRFNEHMATTIGRTIWLPSRQWARDERMCWMVLAHELVHVEDSLKVNGVWFALAYLFPQCLALLAPLALLPGCGWMAWFFLFLAPFPAPWRAKAEFRGYAVSLACCYWRKIPMTGPQIVVEKHFSGPTYYWMWPFKSAVTKKFDRYRWMIAAGTLRREIPIAEQIHKALDC